MQRATTPVRAVPTRGRRLLPDRDPAARELWEEIMNKIYEMYVLLDKRITEWMARHCLVLVRVSLGIVFFWFGS